MSHEDSDAHEGSSAFDAEIREVFARRDAGQHPSSEALSAYVRGELSEAEAERIQEHLGLCRQSTALVLALDHASLESADDGVPEAEVAASVDAIVSRTHAPRSRPWPLLAAAAVLAVACLSLALLTVKLQRQVGALEGVLSEALATSAPSRLSPQTGVPIVDLYPSSVARGEATAPRAIPLPDDAGMVTLILNPPPGPAYDAYALRVTGGDDVEIWRGPARPGEAGTFVVVLPRHFAEQGADRIELYGLDGDAQQLLETYWMRFEL